MHQRYYTHRYIPGKVITGRIDIRNNELHLSSGKIKDPLTWYQKYRPITKETYYEISRKQFNNGEVKND